MAAPNTYGGSLAAATASAEAALGGLDDLETYRCPRTVLCKGVAERVPFASSSQARGRGSTRLLDTTIAAYTGAGADVQSKAKGSGPKRLCAPARSLTQ